MRRSRQQRMADAGQVLGAMTGGLGDAVGSGRTSPPSPYPQPGVRQIEMSTGVELRQRSGWVTPHAVQHLCYPPQEYPQDCGSGSVWGCRCGARWTAFGVAIHSYPVGPARNDVILGPEYWEWVVGTGTDDPKRYAYQQGLWDWRPAVDKILDVLRGQQ